MKLGRPRSVPNPTTREKSRYLDESKSVQIVHDLPQNPGNGEAFSFERVSRNNVTARSHGLHKYPAKFIPQVADWALRFEKSARRETVLDPFCGSGTTLAVAKGLSRNYVGIELNRSYVKLASRRFVSSCARSAPPSCRPHGVGVGRLCREKAGLRCSRTGY